jgi:hypothetical protein
VVLGPEGCPLGLSLLDPLLACRAGLIATLFQGFQLLGSVITFDHVHHLNGSRAVSEKKQTIPPAAGREL